MQHIITGYMPNNNDNLYTYNVRRLLKSKQIDTLPIKKILLSPNLFKKCKIINLNWYENVDGFFGFFFRSMLLSFLKLSHIKIIYTLHNKTPHSMNSRKYGKKIMKKLCIISDAIIGLCPETEEIIKQISPPSVGKLTIIPHPNYIHNYKLDKTNDRLKYGLDNDDIVFMFFGKILPYKNIEILIESFKDLKKENAKLLIIGSADNEQYKNQILEMVGEDKNIICDFRFVPDEEIPALYQTADITVLPYNKTSSLNSGALYLSFSLKRTVVCPDIGTIKALTERDFVYDYSYNGDEHFKQLSICLDRVYSDYMSNRDCLKDKGVKAFRYMCKNHSDEKIATMYEELYNHIIK